MLRDIPMPTIVLGRVSGSENWHLVDGQQRLINSKFMHDYDFRFPIGPSGEHYDKFPEWAKNRIDNYQFFVEEIETTTVRQLAEIYERYNSSVGV